MTTSIARQKLLQAWEVSPREGADIQIQLAPFILCEDRFNSIRTIAGVDTGIQEKNSIVCAAICLFNFPDLKLIENIVTESQTKFPYIPGLLSFREAPAIYKVYRKLAVPPDLLFCDGHGYAHPRRFGLACHLGLLFDVPSIGIAKSLLVGVHDPPGEQRGSWQPIIHQEQAIGAALRTQTGVKPVYVSVGHRISLKTAIDYVLKCTPKYRLPVPIREAHRLASSNQVINTNNASQHKSKMFG